MKSSRRSIVVRSLVPFVLAACAGLATPALAGPVTDEFTYQGVLTDSGNPANGSHDFRFRLYDASAGGVQVGAELLRTANVSNGQFVVQLQFAGAFTGTALWLEIDARPSGGGGFTTLGPRQPLSATPNAAYAMVAGTASNASTLGGQPGSFYTNAGNLNAGTLPSARLSGVYSGALTLNNAGNVFAGNGSALTALNATNVASGTLADARLSSNVDLLNVAQSFTAVKTFSTAPQFSAAGAPFGVSSTTLVTNLNADMVDGMHASAFSLAGHTHAATDVVSGVFADARLSSNVALLNTAQTFSAVKTFGANGIFNANVGIGTAAPSYPLHIVDTGGYALRIDNTGTTATGGVYVVASSTTTEYGFLADLNGTAGTSYNYWANNAGPSGRGLYAIMQDTTGTGTSYGVYVSNSSPSGYGGYFNSTATTGTTYGLYCESNSPDGYGLYALHDSTTGTTPAVYGRTDSTTASAFAIHGLVNSTAPGASSTGVRGQNNGTSGSGIGVWGSHAGSGWGGYFTSGSGIGVYATTTGSSYAVYGYNAGTGNGVRGYSADGYGGYFDTGVAGGAALYVVGTASVGVLTIRGGADLAENFEVHTSPETVQPGMVVMIDDEHEGAMELAAGAYNRRVAGVVSGANELSAGMILGEFEGLKDARPIALSGRVWTYVDATERGVEPGDLLTTSDTPGYAMPVADHSRAHGATIGKAMSRLDKGQKGMVLVLVNLQ